MDLVTGCAGTVGIHLCLKLLKRKRKVIGMDNFITGSKKNLNLLKEYKNFIFIKDSIENKHFRKVLEKYPIKRIFHLACPTGVPNLEIIPNEMISALSIGTKNMLDLAKDKKAKFLLTSSSEVYGNPKEFPQKESYTGNVDTLGIRGPYEEGKRFSETLVETYVRSHKLNAKIVRIFNTFGEFCSLEDKRVIPVFIHNALNNLNLPVHGTGSQKRTFLYIDDLLDGLLLVIEKGEKGQAYNVGSDKQYSILELSKIILKLTKSMSKIEFIKRPSHDHLARKPSLKKIKKLGWNQQYTLREGVKILIKKNKEEK